MSQLTTSYHESLLNALRDPGEAAEYLTAALEDGDPAVLLVALQNVATASGVHPFPTALPPLADLPAFLAQMGLEVAIRSAHITTQEARQHPIPSSRSRSRTVSVKKSGSHRSRSPAGTRRTRD
jgi:hypothetical protein